VDPAHPQRFGQLQLLDLVRQREQPGKVVGRKPAVLGLDAVLVEVGGLGQQFLVVVEAGAVRGPVGKFVPLFRSAGLDARAARGHGLPVGGQRLEPHDDEHQLAVDPVDAADDLQVLGRRGTLD
jgi:hypothetical protein